MVYLKITLLLCPILLTIVLMDVFPMSIMLWAFLPLIVLLLVGINSSLKVE